MNIMKRAAQIRRASGGRIAMTDAVKKAAAERRRKPAKKRAVKKAAKKKAVRRAPAKKVATKRSRKTVASLTSTAKKMVLQDIGSLEARKFATRLKRDKNKIQKKISEKKAIYRKLS